MLRRPSFMLLSEGEYALYTHEHGITAVCIVCRVGDVLDVGDNLEVVVHPEAVHGLGYEFAVIYRGGTGLHNTERNAERDAG